MNQTPRVIRPHGGYRKLKSFRAAAIIYDGTACFCRLYIPRNSRTFDQMVQAARSGKQNIAEGSRVAGTSRRSELKLLGVARGSLSELLEDYLDFLRQRALAVWAKDDIRVWKIRSLIYQADSFQSYEKLVQASPECAANTMICLVFQAGYLLDRQLAFLEKDFLMNGGFTENLFRARAARR